MSASSGPTGAGGSYTVRLVECPFCDEDLRTEGGRSARGGSFGPRVGTPNYAGAGSAGQGGAQEPAAEADELTGTIDWSMAGTRTERERPCRPTHSSITADWPGQERLTSG